MKTFVAVLAAGAIIFAAFVGWQRLDRWEQGKNYWIAALDHAHVNTSPVIPGRSSEDYQRQIDELDGQLKRRRTVAHELRLYLENKPFGLPLTDEENQLLKITGGGHTEKRKTGAQSQSTPTPTTDTPTPTPTDTPTSTPTDTPTPTAIDTPTPTPTPDFVVLTRPVPIKIPYGVISLNPGTRLKLLSRAATTVRVQYQGTDYDIPLSSTDLAK